MLAHLGNIKQTSTRRFVPLPVACMRLAGFVGGSTGANSDACGPLECPLDRTSWCDHLANIPLSPTGGCLTIEFCGGNPTATLCYSMIPKLETRAAHVLFQNFKKSKSILFDFSKLKLQPFSFSIFRNLNYNLSPFRLLCFSTFRLFEISSCACSFWKTSSKFQKVKKYTFRL